MGERREAKKRETRDRISDVATRLFMARGFEQVTLEEIAVRARVSKMTVFNYFPRKEDLMLDRQDDLRLVFLREVVRATPKGSSPIAAMRAFVDELRERKHPLTRVDRMVADWWRFVASSPSLVSRLRELDDEAADGLAADLGNTASAMLAARIIVATIRTSRQQAILVLERGGSIKKSEATLFELIDQGFTAAATVLR